MLKFLEILKVVKIASSALIPVIEAFLQKDLNGDGKVGN